jgi:threonine/homoserine/homoserine lactone efflux protein
MKPIKFIIILTTIFVILFGLVPLFENFPAVTAIVLWVAGHVLIVYMVIRVMRKGVPSAKTFDEGYWYEDRGKIE